MADSNGHDPMDKLRDDLRLLMESSVKNWEEHERIWESVSLLKDAHVELLRAIRALIDRIPPEALRPREEGQ